MTAWIASKTSLLLTGQGKRASVVLGIAGSREREGIRRREKEDREEGNLNLPFLAAIDF